MILDFSHLDELSFEELGAQDDLLGAIWTRLMEARDYSVETRRREFLLRAEIDYIFLLRMTHVLEGE